MSLGQTREESLRFLHDKHPSRSDVFEKTFALVDDIVDAFVVAPRTDPYPRVVAIAILKAKNLALGSYTLILDGLGQEAGALLRAMVEYVEIVTYLRLFPEQTALALEDALPKAGERAKAIRSIYKDLREHLNRNASHAAFSEHSIKHVFDANELRLVKLQRMNPHTLLTNLTGLLVQVHLLVTESLYSLEPTGSDRLLPLAHRFERLKARMFDVYDLNGRHPYQGE